MSDKLDLESKDLIASKLEQLEKLFPNLVTEGENGKVLDLDQIKNEFSTAVVEGAKERYRLEWPGKKEAIVTANLPTSKTLRPVKEDSEDFDTTENLYIEGDNLEVLKILQESYLGKVKMIYIDPPYNTGKDFVYKDNFSRDGAEELEESGQRDEDNQRLVVNPDSSGRYHSDWLSMMYPRLKLARNLLTDDGVIFISLDDKEVHNLRKICDEIFGQQNFAAQIIWKKRNTPPNDIILGTQHDYVMVFSKSDKISLNLRKRSLEQLNRYKNPDNHIKGDWVAGDLTANVKGGRYSEALNYPIKNPNTKKQFLPPNNGNWRFNNEKISRLIANDEIYFGKDGKSSPKLKRFLCDVKKGTTWTTLWDFAPFNTEGSIEMGQLLDNRTIFESPKPSGFIKLMIEMGLSSADIVLDFFSGSATTAHAIMKLNAEDGGTRKHIMVQLPETCDDSSEAYKAGYKNICEIGKERIRRAGKKIIDDETSVIDDLKAKLEKEDDVFKREELEGKIKGLESKLENLDTGFRVYRLDSSNMADVYHTPQDYDQDKLELFSDNVKPDRSPDDLLAQIMLDWGIPLSAKIEEKNIAGKRVFMVAENSLMACFEEGIDEGFAKEIATEEPLRVVFKDAGFANDTAKSNVKQLLKQLSPETEMKVI